MKKKLKKTKKTKPKKKAAKKSAKKAAKPAKPVKKTLKPIGKVTHFYTHLKVAIVKFNTKVSAKTKLHYKGATTDFAEAAKSMQYDHKAIAAAPKGKQVGVKVGKRVREGDLVYKAE